MAYNIDFDICALILIVVQLFCFYYKYKKSIPSLQHKTYLALLILTAAATAADMINAVVTNQAEQSPFWLLNASSYLFFLFLNLLPVVYSFFIIVLTDTHHRLLSTRYGLLFTLPLTVLFGTLLLNPFTNWLFCYDEAKVYHRGSGLYVLYAVAAYYMLYGIVYATIYRDIIAPAKRAALYSFLFLVAGPVIAQSFFPNLLIEMLGVSICMLLIFITIQTPEEILDGQTGLFNRNALTTALNVLFRNQEHFCVISAWISNYDYFKRTFGITTMSNMARQIARQLEQLPGRRKTLYSIDQGHLLLLLPISEMTSGLPQRVKDIMEGGVAQGDMALNLSANICVIYCPEEASDVDSLMEHVDYFDQPLERESAIVYASQQKQSGAARTAAVERAIKDALENGGFEVYYQAIYSSHTQSIRSAEALLRLRDAKLGFIPPDEFIPIAERNGAIIPIGMFVFRSVCDFMTKNDLQNQKIDFIEVNLSVAQCMQNKLAEQLLDVMREYNLPTECISLEITETAAAYSTETLTRNMNALSEAGIKLALDDYGTGFSSMSCMVELPFDLVKLDKGIIAAMDNERAQIAMSNTVAMLKQLKLDIVAEGVETEEQANALIHMGCDYLQGYYYSKPVPGDQFLARFTGTHALFTVSHSPLPTSARSV